METRPADYRWTRSIGLAAAIHSIPVDPHVTFIALPVMIGVHLVLLAFVWYGKIPRVMGGLLVGAYLVYLIVLCWSRVETPLPLFASLYSGEAVSNET